MRKWILLFALIVLLAGGVFVFLKIQEQSNLVAEHEANLEEALEQGADVGQETTQILIDGEDVGIANYWDDSISLYFGDGSVRVSVGDTFEVNSKTYEVLNIWEDERGYAYVSFIESSINIPTFETLVDNVSLAGASMWLFTVNDGEEELAVSSETNGKIQVARMSTSGELTSNWETVASSTDTGGASIADHWHIFANDYHWIVFSVTSAEQSYLLKLDKNFDRVFLKPVTSEGPTNDMFMVAGENALYVGHFKPGTGHTIYEVDFEGDVLQTFTIGGDEFTHANGASALQSESGFHVFVGTSMNFLSQSALLQLSFDSSWAPLSSRTLVDEGNTHISMVSAVKWEDLWVVTARVRTDALPKGELAPPVDPSEPLAADGGQIWRFVFDAEGNELSREVLYDGEDGNRPHMEVVGDTLITTWDANGEAILRMETIL